MQKIIFINAEGEETEELSSTFPYMLQNLKGITAPSMMPLVERGFNQDGSSYLGELMEPRYITLNVVICDADREELLKERETIMRVFNPKLGLGTFRYENEADSYAIKASVIDGPTQVALNGIPHSNLQNFEICFYCPNPAWRRVPKLSLKIEGFEGGLNFLLNPDDSDSNKKLTFPIKFATQGDCVDINYKGTLDSPLLIKFTGPAILPKINNTETGEFIEVNVELEDNEELYIDTNPSAVNVYTKDAEGNCTSAFNYINPFSTYFLLTKGINKLSFDAAGGSIRSVTLYYYEQFIGV